ncbi:MAG: FHA domain-containing protein [Anaerolineae bacterium]|nr:FHA domain-containing protein [Anaerolineae bacterium]
MSTPDNPAPPAPKVVTPAPKPAAPNSTTTDLSSMRATKRLGDVTNNKCPNCDLVNRVGVLVCENCGTSLIAGAVSVPATRNLSDPKLVTGRLFPDRLSDVLGGQKLPFVPAPDKVISPPAGHKTGGSLFDDDMILRLEVVGATIPILVYPKREIVIGRRDVATGTQPDVDLTSYAGYRMGVSRRHAMIQLKDGHLEFVDLGSSNGSKLNGTVVQPHRPFPVRDGDELTFGNMKLRVMFQNGTQRIRLP